MNSVFIRLMDAVSYIGKYLFSLRRYFVLSCLLSMGLFLGTSNAQVVFPERNVSSKKYAINQTFEGQSFFKDNNIWTYSSKFAELFGMPVDGIDSALQGIEAAAFRVEDTSYKLCGMGGKAEQCKQQNRCMLDIYVDEKKYPLPWRDEQKADWHSRFTSALWLRTAKEGEGSPVKAPVNFYPNVAVETASTLHPFADPSNGKEAIYLENSRIDGNSDSNFNFVHVYGYKRQVIEDLTLVVFSIACTPPNHSKESVTYRLESREKIFSPTLKRFHEFVLSEQFIKNIRNVLDRNSEEEMTYFRNLLQNKAVQTK